MSFADAAQEFLRAADALDPGAEPSAELTAHYGHAVASHFGVRRLSDLEATAVVLSQPSIVEDMTATQLVVCALLIGYIAGKKEG